MNKLPPVIFLVPVIALILVVVFYFILLKGLTNKVAFKRFVFITTILAFVLNFAWEIIQIPLYQNNVFDLLHISFCALASVADVIMVLLIYFGFSLVYKNAFWIKNVNILQALLIILTGGIGAILAEMKHLSEGDWAYTFSMPVIPLVNAGISPVLQFMILPLLIYYVSFLLLKLVRKE
ncbi:signal transduction histidine kinase [Pedobacter sp. CG_S7]|uniref:hypothetical protein n=1 Tax=Pedobacter sp. CG_S7 TaxID=3143930 RepID=UPI003394085E